MAIFTKKGVYKPCPIVNVLIVMHTYICVVASLEPGSPESPPPREFSVQNKFARKGEPGSRLHIAWLCLHKVQGSLSKLLYSCGCVLVLLLLYITAHTTADIAMQY